MLSRLPDFLTDYWIYLLPLVIFFSVLAFFSLKVRETLKMALSILGVVFALIIFYELVTGNSIFNISRGLSKILQTEAKNEPKGPGYYNTDRDPRLRR